MSWWSLNIRSCSSLLSGIHIRPSYISTPSFSSHNPSAIFPSRVVPLAFFPRISRTSLSLTLHSRISLRSSLSIWSFIVSTVLTWSACSVSKFPSVKRTRPSGKKFCVRTQRQHPGAADAQDTQDANWQGILRPDNACQRTGRSERHTPRHLPSGREVTGHLTSGCEVSGYLPSGRSAFLTDGDCQGKFLPDAECQGKCRRDDACHGICVLDAECQGICHPDAACSLQTEIVKANFFWRQRVKANVVRTMRATASSFWTRSVRALAIWTQRVSYRRRLSRQISSGSRVSRQMSSGRRMPRHLPSGCGVSGQ